MLEAESLSIPKNLEQYVDARNKAAQSIKHIHMSIDCAQSDLKELGWKISLPVGMSYREKPERHIKELDGRFWRACFDHTGFMSIMDNEARSKFYSSLEKEAPEFTLENIQNTYAALIQDADKMLCRGIYNVFNHLCGDYKTNQKEPFKVGEKVIIGYIFDNYNGNLSRGYSSRAYSTINDIDRVFKILDNEKHNPRELEHLMMNSIKKSGDIYEDDYFYIKGFQNGNAHIKFKKKDLLLKVNKLIAYHYKNMIPGGI